MKIFYKLLLVLSIGLFFNSCVESEQNKDVNQNEPKNVDQKVDTVSQNLSDSEVNDEVSYHSVSEDFISNLNKTLTQNKVTSFEDVAQLYSPKDPYAEGNYIYNLTTKVIDEKVTILEIITEGIMDDSLDGLKIIIELDCSQEFLQVISIKEAYKCKQGRGQQDWSSELCL